MVGYIEIMEMSQEHVWFSSGDLQLEGVLHLPQREGPFHGVVVCHPHPLYGGSMFDNVVAAICRGVIEASIVAVRFNFRGVGQSTGSFCNGLGEQEDVVAALTFLSSLHSVDSTRMGLSGYSFGAAVALPVSVRDERVQALALISPPFPLSEWEGFHSYSKPCLIMGGTEDELFSHPTSLPNGVHCELIPAADHFWRGHEAQVSTSVSTFFSSALRPEF